MIQKINFKNFQQTKIMKPTKTKPHSTQRRLGAATPACISAPQQAGLSKIRWRRRLASPVGSAGEAMSAQEAEEHRDFGGFR
jgi:hypothetical protein